MFAESSELGEFGVERERLASEGSGLEQIEADYRLLGGASTSLTFPEMLPPVLKHLSGTVDRPALFCEESERLLGAVPGETPPVFVALDFLPPDAARVLRDSTAVMFDPARPLDEECAARLLGAAPRVRRFLERVYGDYGLKVGLQLVDEYKNQLTSAAPRYKRSLVAGNSVDEIALTRFCSSLWIGCGVGLIGSEATDIIVGTGAALATAYLDECGDGTAATLARAYFGEHPRASTDFRDVFAMVVALRASERGRRELRELVKESWGESVGATTFLRELTRLRNPAR